MTTATAKPSTENELVITRVFDAPRALVFKVWTDPRHLKNWFGPREYPAAQMDADVRPGGVWRACLKSIGNDPDLWVGGVYREIAAPERLVFTFAWEEEGERGLETVVTITFAEEGAKTRITLRQAPFQSVEERDGHVYGWSSALERFDELLVRVNRSHP